MLPALKNTVRHYGRNYSAISEQSECGRLCFYTTIESLYGANRFTVTERELFYDAYCTLHPYHEYHGLAKLKMLILC